MASSQAVQRPHNRKLNNSRYFSLLFAISSFLQRTLVVSYFERAHPTTLLFAQGLELRKFKTHSNKEKKVKLKPTSRHSCHCQLQFLGVRRVDACIGLTICYSLKVSPRCSPREFLSTLARLRKRVFNIRMVSLTRRASLNPSSL